jgi:PRTRC genetic system protein E
MNTNFFQNIADLQVQGSFKLAIHVADQGKFVVSLLFNTDGNGDSAYKVVPPMVLKGTAQELDEGFFEAIQKPIQQTAGLFQNMEAYLKSLEEAKKLSKMEADKAKPKPAPKTPASGDGIEVPEPKVDKEAKRKIYDEAMKQINELNYQCKYGDALKLLPTIEDYPEKQAELDKKRADLIRKKEQHDKMLQLF